MSLKNKQLTRSSFLMLEICLFSFSPSRLTTTGKQIRLVPTPARPSARSQQKKSLPSNGMATQATGSAGPHSCVGETDVTSGCRHSSAQSVSQFSVSQHVVSPCSGGEGEQREQRERERNTGNPTGRIGVSVRQHVQNAH